MLEVKLFKKKVFYCHANDPLCHSLSVTYVIRKYSHTDPKVSKTTAISINELRGKSEFSATKNVDVFRSFLRFSRFAGVDIL